MWIQRADRTGIHRPKPIGPEQNGSLRYPEVRGSLGQETAFSQVGTNSGDSYQDLEVEFNADGTIAGYVVGGLGFCPDTVRLSSVQHDSYLE